MNAQDKKELLERGIDTRAEEEIIETLKAQQERLDTMTDAEKKELDRLKKEDGAKYSWMTEGL